MNGRFVRYIVPPKSLYYGCVKSLTDTTGITEVRCWNNTIRKYPSNIETEEERAVGVLYTEYSQERPGSVVYYRNGTIVAIDANGNSQYLRPPTSFFVKNTTHVLSDGTIEVRFENGTTFFRRPPPKRDASPYDRAVAEEWSRDFNNGTREVKYFNGTHLIERRNSDSTTNIQYIRAPEAYAQQISGEDSVVMSFSNGTQKVFYPPPGEEASEELRATAPEYIEKRPDGTFIMGYFNGTIALFNTSGVLITYIKRPEYFYGEVTRQDFSDGSFALFYMRNRTVRVFPRPLPATAT